MNKLKTIILFYSLLLLSHCQAQEKPNILIDSSKIPKSAAALLFRNNFINTIRPNLLKYESSSLEYNKFQKKVRDGKLTYLAGMLICGVFVIANKDNPQKAPLIVLGSAFCTGGIVAIFLSSAKRHLAKSIRNYNIEALK